MRVASKYASTCGMSTSCRYACFEASNPDRSEAFITRRSGCLVALAAAPHSASHTHTPATFDSTHTQRRSYQSRIATFGGRARVIVGDALADQYTSCCIQAAVCKLLCASCVQAAVCKLLYTSCCVQAAIQLHSGGHGRTAAVIVTESQAVRFAVSGFPAVCI